MKGLGATMQKLFGDEIVGEIRKNFEVEGLKGVDTKQLLVLIAAYFNDEISSLRNEVGKIGWFIFGAIVSVTLGLIANLIVALLAK